MVDSQYRTGLYVTMPLYFVFLVGAAFWARKRMENMKHDGVSDALAAHYLGGRSFGPFLTAGTIFASFFSGYTVVGVPNEAFRSGWNSLRWLAGSYAVLFVLIGVALRLRKASLIRNHQSATDFITDRYQSQVLRYSVLFAQVVSSLFYIAAQVVALQSTFNGLFGIDPNDPTAVTLIFVLILIMEFMGGLSTVAFTDAVQGVIMVVSFILLPIVIVKNFGGWSMLNPETYPRPEFYQTPTKEQQWDFFQFNVMLTSAFCLPHILIRLYAARDLKSLKVGLGFMTLGPWLTMLPGIFMGTLGVQLLAGETVTSPFSAILEKVMEQGGFPQVVAVIAFTASLAAIMSSADSVVIAVSHLITTEIIYPTKPDITPAQIARLGRLSSTITVALALLIGLLWDSGVSDLISIQYPITMQAMPAFFWGLYASEKWDVHPWCQSVGILVSILYVVLIYFLYIKNNESAKPINSGVTGIMINVFLAVALEACRRFMCDDSSPKDSSPRRLLFPNRPLWDIPYVARFGDATLSPHLLAKAMKGMNEPFRNLWYLTLGTFSVVMLTPLVPENEPVDPEDAASVNGAPWWAFKIIVLSVVPTLITAYTVKLIPSDVTIDDERIFQEGIDPDIVELTAQEAANRASYDAPNLSIRKRRQSVHKQMQELGLEENCAEKQPLTEEQRRLSSTIRALPENNPEPEQAAKLSSDKVPHRKDDSSVSGFDVCL